MSKVFNNSEPPQIAINMCGVDINKIFISDGFGFGKKDSKYFIGFTNDRNNFFLCIGICKKVLESHMNHSTKNVFKVGGIRGVS